MTAREAAQLSGNPESFQVEMKKKSKNSFQGSVSCFFFFFFSQSRKQTASDDSLLLNFEHVKWASCSGGLMESLQEQEAKPRFMFDGRKMIGGKSAEAGT